MTNTITKEQFQSGIVPYTSNKQHLIYLNLLCDHLTDTCFKLYS